MEQKWFGIAHSLELSSKLDNFHLGFRLDYGTETFSFALADGLSWASLLVLLVSQCCSIPLTQTTFCNICLIFEIGVTVLCWFYSFFSDRLKVVVLGDSYSTTW